MTLQEITVDFSFRMVVCVTTTGQAQSTRSLKLLTVQTTDCEEQGLCVVMYGLVLQWSAKVDSILTLKEITKHLKVQLSNGCTSNYHGTGAMHRNNAF